MKARTPLPYHLELGNRVSPDFNIRDEMGGKVVQKVQNVFHDSCFKKY